MNLWQITSFTLMAALDGDAADAAVRTAARLGPGARAFRGRVLLDTLVSLPLVMPPVATGLLLLMLFAPRGPIGAVLGEGGHRGRVHPEGGRARDGGHGAAFFVRTARAGFEQVERRYEAPRRDARRAAAGGSS